MPFLRFLEAGKVAVLGRLQSAGELLSPRRAPIWKKPSMVMYACVVCVYWVEVRGEKVC